MKRIPSSIKLAGLILLLCVLVYLQFLSASLRLVLQGAPLNVDFNLITWILGFLTAGLAVFLLVRLVQTCRRVWKNGPKQKAACCVGLAVVVMIALVWAFHLLPLETWHDGTIQEGTLTAQGRDNVGCYLTIVSKDEPEKKLKLYCTASESALCAPGEVYYVIQYEYHPWQKDVGYLTLMANPNTEYFKFQTNKP